MSNRLKDKAIIVIGSGSGIGAATVRRLAAEGARICAADINIAGAQSVAADVVAKGGEAFAVPSISPMRHRSMPRSPRQLRDLADSTARTSTPPTCRRSCWTAMP